MTTLEEQIAKIDRKIERANKKAEPLRAQLADINAEVDGLSTKRRNLEHRIKLRKLWEPYAAPVLAAWEAYCAGERSTVLVPTNNEPPREVRPLSRHGVWIVHEAVDVGLWGRKWTVTLAPCGLSADTGAHLEDAIALAQRLHKATPADFDASAYHDPVPAWMKRAHRAHHQAKRSKSA